jgi:hypothetical protein
VEFAVLAAGIDVVQHVAQQIRIEAPPGEAAIELARIEAGDTGRLRQGFAGLCGLSAEAFAQVDAGGKPARDHFAREVCHLTPPEREDQARARFSHMLQS